MVPEVVIRFEAVGVPEPGPQDKLDIFCWRWDDEGVLFGEWDDLV